MKRITLSIPVLEPGPGCRRARNQITPTLAMYTSSIRQYMLFDVIVQRTHGSTIDSPRLVLRALRRRPAGLTPLQILEEFI